MGRLLTVHDHDQESAPYGPAVQGHDAGMAPAASLQRGPGPAPGRRPAWSPL